MWGERCGLSASPWICLTGVAHRACIVDKSLGQLLVVGLLGHPIMMARAVKSSHGPGDWYYGGRSEVVVAGQ